MEGCVFWGRGGIGIGVPGCEALHRSGFASRRAKGAPDEGARRAAKRVAAPARAILQIRLRGGRAGGRANMGQYSVRAAGGKVRLRRSEERVVFRPVFWAIFWAVWFCGFQSCMYFEVVVVVAVVVVVVVVVVGCVVVGIVVLRGSAGISGAALCLRVPGVPGVRRQAAGAFTGQCSRRRRRGAGGRAPRRGGPGAPPPPYHHRHHRPHRPHRPDGPVPD